MRSYLNKLRDLLAGAMCFPAFRPSSWGCLNPLTFLFEHRAKWALLLLLGPAHHTGPFSAVGSLFYPLWQYAQCLNCMDWVSDFDLVFIFPPSLTFLLLLVVLSCCSTVSSDINHMVFNLSHCDNNSCLIIFCKNFSFTTAAFQKKSTKNTPKNPAYEKPSKALKKCQCHLNM